MSDQEQNNEPRSFHKEGEAIVFDQPVSNEEIARQRREDEQHEFARDQVVTNRRIATFTGFLVFATFCTIAVGIWQGVISQTSADAAKSAAKTAADTLVVSQRAFMSFSGPILDLKSRTVSLNGINTGHSTARNVTVRTYEESMFGETSGTDFVPRRTEKCWRDFNVESLSPDNGRVAWQLFVPAKGITADINKGMERIAIGVYGSYEIGIPGQPRDTLSICVTGYYNKVVGAINWAPCLNSQQFIAQLAADVHAPQNACPEGARY